MLCFRTLSLIRRYILSHAIVHETWLERGFVLTGEFLYRYGVVIQQCTMFLIKHLGSKECNVSFSCLPRAVWRSTPQWRFICLEILVYFIIDCFSLFCILSTLTTPQYQNNIKSSGGLTFLIIIYCTICLLGNSCRKRRNVKITNSVFPCFAAFI